MNNNTHRFDLNSTDAASVRRGAVSYGVSEGFDIVQPYSPEIGLDLLTRMRFLFSELFGLWFVALSTFYIFAVPVSLTGAARIKVMLNRIVKRTLDVIGATVGLIISLPIMLVVPVLIKLDSSGPVFYTQMRIGVNRRKKNRRYCQRADIDENLRCQDRRKVDYLGKPFKVVKFRTMVHNAERQSGPVWATKNDPRITRFGSFLRRARLDEVPQFLNVLKGDMSLVGPRPERPKFVKDLSTKVAGYSERLSVNPGLTGLAQIESGYDSSLASVVRKVNFDRQYIREWTLWSDIKILLKTVVVVITGRGAC